MDLQRAVRMAQAHAGHTSLDELCRATGVSRGYLWQLRTGRQANPGLETLVKIAFGCGVPLSRMISWGEEP